MRNIDDMLYLFTGRRLRDVVGRGVTLFGDQIARKASEAFTGTEEMEVPEDSPYRVLGINPDAPDFLVRAAYKSLMKEYHPDGKNPDEVMAMKINGAYERICLEREMPK